MANLSIRRGEQRQPLASIWDPARMMDPLRMMDPFRMIRDFFGSDPFASMVPAASAIFTPDIEIKETKDGYALKIDLPGVREQDLDVSITGNRLTVSGKREEEERREDDRFFAYERSYGAFSRSFVLPEGADLEKTKAELKNGVLDITVPKKAEMQPRRIEIGGKQEGAAAPSGGQAAEKTGGKKAA